MPDGKASTDRGQGPAGRADVTALPGAEQAAVVGAGPRRRLASRRHRQAHSRRQVHQLADALQPDRQAGDGSHAPGHLVQQGAGDARTADQQAGDPLATTKGGLSLYRAEGKEVEYSADEGSTRRRSKTPNIPPYAEDWSLTGITPVTEDITLYAMSPHMHLRGKSLKWVIVYPDGREQTILDVPKFDFNWQIQYELKSRCTSRPAARFSASACYDNSPKNKWNPAPNLRGLLVRAELGRDVPAFHGVLGGQSGDQRDDRRQTEIDWTKNDE